MKITIISLDNWGFNKHIYNDLLKKNHTVNHIDFNEFVYEYPNFLFKILNFVLKTFFKKNLKNIYYGKEIINRLKNINETQDVILTIKGDFIDYKYIKTFKNFTKKSIGFFNDNTYRCPKIIKVIPYFDEVYSFEKEDCIKFNLKFATNWIFNTNLPKLNFEFKYDVFNISSKDNRLPIILKIAAELKKNNINYKILIFSKKNDNNDEAVNYISKKHTLEEVNDYIKESKVLLDIHRKGQNGLSFRVFESIGLNKKLITTNADIKNYDFYNPNNIIVIDEHFTIEKSFFETPYEQIPENIYKKYTVEGWLERLVFSEF